jgi:ribonucleoside-diphosphate reductase alpha chain
MKKYDIQIDNSRDELFTDFGSAVLKDRYLLEGETQQELFKRVALAYSDNEEHAQRIYDYISKMWFMPATPILANGGTNRGLPISCFLNEMQDSLDSIAKTWNENVYLASSGGGIGTHIGNIRSINEEIVGKGHTSGVIPFIKVVDSMTLAISQGCYDDETEILTEKGFIKFADLKKYNHNLKVAQVTPNADNFEFVKYTDFIEYKTSEHLYSFKNAEGHTNLLVTGNHRMATQNIKRVRKQRVWRQDLRIVEADKLSCNRDVRFVNAVPKRNGKKHFLTQLERFLIAYQADGSTNPSGSSNGNVSGSKIYNFHFKKQRKIERLENILNEVGLYYTKSFGNNNDTTICVRVPNEIIATKHFNEWVNVSDITHEWACSFIDELRHWDGSQKSDNCILYSTVNSKNADLAQIIGIVAGYKTKLIQTKRDITRQDLYTVSFVKNSRYTSAEKIVPEKKYYDGYVYCVTVPTGLLIVRRNGGVAICGNSLRRGSAAVYMQDTHPEIEEFLDIRRPTGDTNRRCLNIHHGVCVSDEFMEAVEKGAMWDLKSPKTGKVLSTTSARNLWIKLLASRVETGEPYILFTGNVQKNKSKVYQALEKEYGLKVKTSNLCVEIMLQTGLDQHKKERTAVCCLSSLNLEYYEEWKNNEFFIEDVARFLDNVLTDFIDKAPDAMERAKYSSMREHSIGIGVMGFHSFLQSKKTPFASVSAKAWNKAIFKHIKEKCDIANEKLADEKGACPDALELGINHRFANMQAIAPTASISIIAGNSSAGIEPYPANCYTHKTLSGSFIVKNRPLKKLLQEKGYDSDTVWSSIALNEGSVQHLDFLNQDEKDVFKTAMEIDQMWIVQHAADRQPFIDQGQSTNLFFASNVEKRVLHDIHFAAWKKGVKSLYYCRSSSIQRAEKSEDKFSKEQEKAKEVVIPTQPEYDECLACQ